MPCFFYLWEVKLFRGILYPFGLLYGTGVALRNLAYDRGWKKAHVLPVPVVSVGNISVGGTGKTPMAEFLLEHLLAAGARPAYLSRGYGRKTTGFLRVDPKDDRGGLQYGDEAFQVAHKFPKVPVAVCENRVTGVEQLLKTTKTDIVVLDDAFQHRRIHRDLDIVMVDGSRLPADDLLLPAGRLREPVRNLARAQAVIVTKVPDAEAATRAVRTLNGSRRGFRTAVFGLRPKAVQSVAEDLAHPPSFLQNHPVHLFSGLGNNTAFAHTTRQLGATVLSHTTFPDHHAYKPADIQKILAEYAPETENKGKLAPPLLLTTEKDFFRLKALGLLDHFSEVPLHYLQVKMVPEMGWEAIAAQINALIESNDNPN